MRCLGLGGVTRNDLVGFCQRVYDVRRAWNFGIPRGLGGSIASFEADARGGGCWGVDGVISEAGTVGDGGIYFGEAGVRERGIRLGNGSRSIVWEWIFAFLRRLLESKRLDASV